MSQYLWASNDLITAARLNANGYSLWKGVVGSEDTVILADNVAGTFQLKPNVDPAASTQLWQVKNAAAAVQAAITADGSFIPNVAGSVNTVQVKLDEVVLAAPAATVTLTPSGTYRHLEIVGYLRSDIGAWGIGTPPYARLRFNGDTGANYTTYLYQPISFTPTTSLAATSILLCGMVSDGAAANVFSTIRASIPHYQNAANQKLVSAETKIVVTGDGTFQATSAGIWTGVAAVTSVTIFPATGNFMAGSIFSLYGTP